jgi:hypothetical protein
LTILAAVAAIAFSGFSIVKALLNASQKETQAEAAAPVTLDENDALKATIDTLEVSWQEVQDRVFTVNQDPLYLGRVLKDFTSAKAGFKESEEDDQMRLTATVVDDNPKAIIKYNGKSYVVQRGEFIEAYRVVSIEKKQVVLEGKGSRVVLENKPIQGLEETGGASDYSNNQDAEARNY